MAYMSVSELNNKIKSLLETTFMQVIVQGEISNLTYHSSGHIYFSVKDRDSSIRAVMFKGNARNLKFRLEVGLKIIITGAITLYTPRGEYQIMCSKIEPLGEGALALAYEQLKAKLAQKGYFDKENKKPIPKFINHIAIVTSSTGAAIEDMLRVANSRWKLLKITLIDTIVQGEASAKSISNNIMYADKLDADVIIVGRGGGSKEDLWGFNEEIVADAIHHATTPIVSAVGHEIDYMISDFTADMRAPTPSAAIQMILPDMYEYLQYIDDMHMSYNKSISRLIENKEYKVDNLFEQYQRNSIESKLNSISNEIKELESKYNSFIEYKISQKSSQVLPLIESFDRAMQSILSKKDNELILLKSSITANKPEAKMKRGYAQIVKDNKPISLENIKAKDSFVLQDEHKVVEAQAIKTRKIKG
jgi:exodeoxyribonuclease VII large subunit